MLSITDDEAHGCLVLRPTGSLRTADLEALSERFDARVKAGGQAPNLVIVSPGFPTWSNMAAMLAHLDFIRSHHRQIGKVALVSDARALDVAPKLAGLIVSARLRHFPAEALDEALAWVGSHDEAPDVTLMQGLPGDTVGIVVNGVIGADDYAATIAPALEAALASHERINVIYQVGPGFETFTPGALWSDARIGTAHLSRFAKVALVTDIPWMRSATRVFAPLLPGEVRVFAGKELDAAKAWTAEAPEAATT